MVVLLSTYLTGSYCVPCWCKPNMLRWLPEPVNHSSALVGLHSARCAVCVRPCEILHTHTHTHTDSPHWSHIYEMFINFRVSHGREVRTILHPFFLYAYNTWLLIYYLYIIIFFDESLDYFWRQHASDSSSSYNANLRVILMLLLLFSFFF